MIRLALTVVAVLVASTAAHAQAPGKIRPITTASPVPVIVLQQQQAWNAALQQAYLNRISQPPIFVNPFPVQPFPMQPFPVQPLYNPLAYSPSATTFRWTGVTATGTLYEATKTYYSPAPAFNPYSPFR